MMITISLGEFFSFLTILCLTPKSSSSQRVFIVSILQVPVPHFSLDYLCFVSCHHTPWAYFSVQKPINRIITCAYIDYQAHSIYYISEIILGSDSSYPTVYLSSKQFSRVDSFLITILNCEVLQEWFCPIQFKFIKCNSQSLVLIACLEFILCLINHLF